jgi:8-oxo-dGTP pyrophosphatase MutT (NUDIX family)
VAHDGPDGVEVVMLRRSDRNRFAPGFVVFPGGAQEPEDAALAQRWFGDQIEIARACAIRELGEETGLALRRSGLRTITDGEHPVDAVSQAPPDTDALVEIGRWVAPEFLAVRFDAVFFAVRAHEALPLRVDGVEEDLAWWARPADVLAEGVLYETLMWPTYRTLQALAACRTVDGVLRLSVEQEPPPPGGRARSPEWRPAEPSPQRRAPEPRAG